MDEPMNPLYLSEKPENCPNCSCILGSKGRPCVFYEELGNWFCNVCSTMRLIQLGYDAEQCSPLMV